MQISDENLHHVRELMDEVFGPENACSIITFAKTSSASGYLLSTVSDYLLWYSKDREQVKYRHLFCRIATSPQKGPSPPHRSVVM